MAICGDATLATKHESSCGWKEAEFKITTVFDNTCPTLSFKGVQELGARIGVPSSFSIGDESHVLSRFEMLPFSKPVQCFTRAKKHSNLKISCGAYNQEQTHTLKPLSEKKLASAPFSGLALESTHVKYFVVSEVRPFNHETKSFSRPSSETVAAAEPLVELLLLAACSIASHRPKFFTKPRTPFAGSGVGTYL